MDGHDGAVRTSPATWAAGHAATVRRPTAPRAPGARPVLTAGDLNPILLHTLDANRNVADGQRPGPWRGGARALAMTELPGGGSLLATGTHHGSVALWDPESGLCHRMLEPHADTVYDVALHVARDGSVLLASASFDGTVRVADAISGEQQLVFSVTGRACAVQFVQPADGDLVLVVGGSDAVSVHDLGSGSARLTIGGLGGDVLTVAAASADGGVHLIASADENGRVDLWECETGSIRHSLRASSTTIRRVQFEDGPNGPGALLLAGSDGIAGVFPIDGVPAVTRFARAGVHVEAAALIPNIPELAAVADGNNAIRVWNYRDGVPVRDLVAMEQTIWSNAFGWARDGRLLMAAGDMEGEIRIWQLTGPVGRAAATSGRTGPRRVSVGPERVRLGDERRTRGVEFVELPDRPPLLVTGGDGLRVWDVASHDCLHTLDVPGGSAWYVSTLVRRDGSALLAATEHMRPVTLWDPSSGSFLGELSESRFVAKLANGPDGSSVLLTGGESGLVVESRSAATGALIRQFRGLERAVFSIATVLLPDGRQIVAAAGLAGIICIWDYSDGTLTHRLAGHGRDICSMDFVTMRDGTVLLVSGSLDGTVKIWDLSSDECRLSIDAGAQVRSVRALPLADGGAVVAAAVWDSPYAAPGPGDNAAYLWDIMTGDRLAQIAPRVSYSAYSTEYLALAAMGPGRYLFAYSGDGATVLTTVEIEVDDVLVAPESARFAQEVVRVAADGVPALASAGITAPLSLVADLVQLTGAQGRPEHLAMLAEHRGVTRLRALGWPPAARVGLAALLAEQATFDPAFVPPEATVPELRRALDDALNAPPAAYRPVAAPVGALVAAAEEVGEQTVTMLALLGPDAVRADPTLPLRARHLVAALPALDPRARAAITDIPRQVSAQLDARAASARTSAGTVGLRRRGEPRNLLRTQLALPPGLFRLEQARGNLLYRLHEGEPRLVLEPTVLVLDTTPPVFGPMEIALRLVAHGIAQLLLEQGQDAALVALDRPDRVTPLRRTADLMALWTTRTLEPPDLTTALHTAGGAGAAVAVVLTMRRAAERHGLTGRPGLRVVMTHAPGERAGRDTSPYVVRVPPRPTAADVGRAVAGVLAGGDAR